MPSAIISCLILLIPISSASTRSTTQCVGESTKLSCLDLNNRIEDNREINALWKKHSGERVIWRYYGESKTGHSFTNRTKLNGDLSLSIDGCDPSDQGIYILCINGKPSCEIKLFVKASKQCNKPKSFTEQPTTTMATEVISVIDEKDLQTGSSLPNNNIRYIVYATICSCCLFVLVVLLLVVCACNQRKETSKNDKSESTLLHTQSNYAKA